MSAGPFVSLHAFIYVYRSDMGCLCAGGVRPAAARHFRAVDVEMSSDNGRRDDDGF